MKDIGGGEWFQLYRYDVSTGDVTLLTDGKSRNLPGPWSSSGNQIAYVSTRRTGQDTDLWVMNPADPKTRSPADATERRRMGAGGLVSRRQTHFVAGRNVDQRIVFVAGGYDDRREDGADCRAMRKEKVAYSSARFSKDGKGIYVTTDLGSEFQRLALLDLAGKNPKFLTTDIPWDVESFDLTHDGKRLAFVTNEDG